MDLLIKGKKDKNNFPIYEVIDKSTDKPIEKVVSISFGLSYTSGPTLTIETLGSLEYNGPCNLQILPKKG